ncbi:SpoIID/LytB domain-containing protein [Cyanobium sp. NS01]|uniref:SpoIID/LytB domain-containing protein n=1 Tax=Cyanobium sp. NS01 TaxID=261284 RepID=UPI001862B3C9|nr:SpoIID/LytB domain-containing protein [Cyanobium sp. NS01]QNI69882.1 stage II sporulation protein D [Cyanobium sp. NS01]
MALHSLISRRSDVILPLALALPVVALVPSGSELQAQQGEPEIRVLLAEGNEIRLSSLRQPLVLRSGARSPALLELAPATALVLRLQGGRLQVQSEAGSRELPAAKGLWLEAKEPGVGAREALFQLQKRHYRGRLMLRREGQTLQAINHIGLETYLPSVVGSEMPASWPQAALRAQAVAARTYALRQRKPGSAFDVTATVSSQVYKGVEAETDSTRSAVASTRSQVLFYQGKLATTVFHSSSGGRTENSGDLWTRQLPYLVSVPDFDHNSPVHQWEKPLPPQALRQAFAETGGVRRIDVLATTATGRVRQARVIGPAGTLVVTGPQLRSRLGLRSTKVRFEVVEPSRPLTRGLPTPPPPVLAVSRVSTTPLAQPFPAVDSATEAPSLLAIGRGFGHGVGMSQWGALAMAEQGRSHETILSHYFRGTQLRRYP